MGQNLLEMERSKYLIIRGFGIVNLYKPKLYYVTGEGGLLVCGAILV